MPILIDLLGCRLPQYDLRKGGKYSGLLDNWRWLRHLWSVFSPLTSTTATSYSPRKITVPARNTRRPNKSTVLNFRTRLCMLAYRRLRGSALSVAAENERQSERIIGQWINGEQTGYSFGFEGPPGVGKTSLAKNGLANCSGSPDRVYQPNFPANLSQKEFAAAATGSPAR